MAGSLSQTKSKGACLQMFCSRVLHMTHLRPFKYFKWVHDLWRPPISILHFWQGCILLGCADIAHLWSLTAVCPNPGGLFEQHRSSIWGSTLAGNLMEPQQCCF